MNLAYMLDTDSLSVSYALRARSLDLKLVTNNTKHFEQVAGLKIENWT